MAEALQHKNFKCTTLNYYYMVMFMTTEVVVTRKGQTTIPAQLRRKFKIEEGTRLEVIETEEGILFKPKKSTWDLAGSGAQFSTPEEMKTLLDKLRKEDA
jgi:AbrB family looped-hinge helix DNA binding protein